jgi:type II secretory pathway component PulM
MDKYLKWALIAGMAVISCSVFYYFVIFLPHSKEEDTTRQQSQQSLARRRAADAAATAQQQTQQSLERQRAADAIAATKQQEQYATLKAGYRAECVATEKRNLEIMNKYASTCQGDLRTVQKCLQSITDVMGADVGESFIVACTNNKLKE